MLDSLSLQGKRVQIILIFTLSQREKWIYAFLKDISLK